MQKFILSTLLFLLSTTLYCQEKAYNEGKLSPYTAHFISAYHHSANDTTLQKKFGVKRQEEQIYIDAFVELNANCDIEMLEKTYGIKVRTSLPSINMITASVPAENIEALALHPDVKRVEMGIPVKAKMDAARPAGNVDKVHEGLELPYPYTGKDVVIGIIDGGFQYNHPNFYSADKSEFRVKSVWNQNKGEKGKYTTEEEITAQGYDDYALQYETHATHVAGIAAGSYKSDNDSAYYGVAPEAELIFVSYDADNSVSISDAIAYVYDYAESVDKPAVVNMSLGTHIGPHDGTSAFDRACDEMQGEGKLLVGAAGNEGSSKVHLSKTFNATNNSLNTFIAFYDKTYQSWVDMWSEANKSFTVEIIVYDKTTGEESSITGKLKSDNTRSHTYPLTEITANSQDKISVYTRKNGENSKSNVTVITELTKALPSSVYLGIKISATEGTVHAWADNSYSYFSNNNIEGWTSGNGNNSMGEIGGTGKRIISVGAYNSKQSFRNTNGILYSIKEKNGAISSFSSFGPTIDGRMKPDITAPGMFIVSSYTDKTYNFASTYRNTVVSRIENNYYGAMQGTSMAAPFVTGVLATWLQANPDLSPEDVRKVLSSSSITDSHTGEIGSQGNNTWGHGKIDAWEGIKRVNFLKNIGENQEEDSNISVYQDVASRTLKLQLLSSDIKQLTIRLYTLNGQCAINQTISINDITQPISTDISTLQPGIYVLNVTGENVVFALRKRLILLIGL